MYSTMVSVQKSIGEMQRVEAGAVEAVGADDAEGLARRSTSVAGF